MTLARRVLDTVRAHAAEARPRECCGLLVGERDAVVRAVRAKNLSADPNRYLIDPVDHLRALRDARAEGLDVLGFYHSHPHSTAEPSATDLREATYPDCVYLILGVRGDQEDLRLFRLRSGVAMEVGWCES